MIDNPTCVSDWVSCKFNINNCIKIEITIVMLNDNNNNNNWIACSCCEYNDIRDGISQSLGIYNDIYKRYIYTIEIISNVTFHMSGPFIVW